MLALHGAIITILKFIMYIRKTQIAYLLQVQLHFQIDGLNTASATFEITKIFSNLQVTLAMKHWICFSHIILWTLLPFEICLFYSNALSIALLCLIVWLLTHIVAHSTRPSFRPKTNNQPLKKCLSLAISWVKVVNNWTSF